MNRRDVYQKGKSPHDLKRRAVYEKKKIYRQL